MVTVSPSGNTTTAVTYTPIATQTLGSAAASVTFSSIPGTYKDLVLVCNYGMSVVANVPILRFNSDSGSNYSQTSIYGNGTSAASGRDTNNSGVYFLDFLGTGGITNICNSIIQIMNYANTTTYKTTLMRDNDSSKGTDASVGLWRNTAAITTIGIVANANNINSGSTFTLYGIGA